MTQEKSNVPCKLCNWPANPQSAYNRTFYRCRQCDFVFALDYDVAAINRGMGMEGSWSGPGGGGYREYFLVKMLERDLRARAFLLFGTGNTPTFERLLTEGACVTGCDISEDVVAYKKEKCGNNNFFTPDTLPDDRKYDTIVAVEVFEHFAEPRQTINRLVSLLNGRAGIICGTTDFNQGTRIEDDNSPGYMSHKGHIAYWCAASMRRAVSEHGLTVAAFEMIRPGSLLPDERFGQLWPNKRVFFIYAQEIHGVYFDTLFANTPILPIDNP